jgi:autotransporter-associated beta strand protein
MLFRAGENDGDFITLSGAGNQWSGNTTIFTNNIGAGAGLRLGRTNALPVTTSVASTGGFGGTGNSLDLNGFDQTLRGLVPSEGNLAITNLKSGTESTLTLDTAVEDFTSVSVNGTLSPTIITDGVGGTGTVSLVKRGAFKQTLTGNHTYTGTTSIEAGTLAFASGGSLGNSFVDMSAGSTLDVSGITEEGFAITAGLSGSGNLTATGKTVTISNTFSPGVMAVTGNVTLAPGTATTLVASSAPISSSAVAITDGTLVFDGNLDIYEAPPFYFAAGQNFAFISGNITSGLDGVTVNGIALVESPADVWTATISGLDYTFSEATGTLAISGGAVNMPPQDWFDLYFPTDGNDGTGIGANDADPDNDFVPNLVEYATNTNPRLGNANPLEIGTNANLFTLTFTRISDPSLIYTIQSRSDLLTGDWAEVVEAPPATNNPSFGFTSSNPNVIETETETVTDSQALTPPATKRFYRLLVEFMQ